MKQVFIHNWFSHCMFVLYTQLYSFSDSDASTIQGRLLFESFWKKSPNLRRECCHCLYSSSSSLLMLDGPFSRYDAEYAKSDRITHFQKCVIVMQIWFSDRLRTSKLQGVFWCDLASKGLVCKKSLWSKERQHSTSLKRGSLSMPRIWKIDAILIIE